MHLSLWAAGPAAARGQAPGGVLLPVLWRLWVQQPAPTGGEGLHDWLQVLGLLLLRLGPAQLPQCGRSARW